MIKVYKEDTRLILKYEAYQPINWVTIKFEVEKTKVHSKNLFPFILSKEDLIGEIDEDNNEAYFLIGEKIDNYWKIKSNCLNIEYNIYLSDDLDISIKLFRNDANFCIFHTIFEIIKQDLWIGGEHPGNLPINDFKALQANLPSRTELHHYSMSRISHYLIEYFNSAIDFEERYEKYRSMQQKRMEQIILNKTKSNQLNCIYANNEIEKYKDILETLKTMLNHYDDYSEKDWQKKIVDILLLLYPKYIAILENVKIKNIYTNKNKFLDFLFVDTNGNTDVVEIKKPFEKCILKDGQYRNNYIPRAELSGAVMQVEKYLFCMNKLGIAGEKTIESKYKSNLPSNVSIHITNPKGIIILGRSKDFDEEQKMDFELIKRKYTNVIDILSYDDLLQRLERLIQYFEKQSLKDD